MPPLRKSKYCLRGVFRYLVRRSVFIGIILLHSSSHLHTQELANLNFDQLYDSSKTGLCHWGLSWGASNSCKPDDVNGNRALLIELNNGVGWAEQELHVEPSQEIQVIQINARLKTDGVIEKGAGLNVGIYDGEGNLMLSKDSGNYGDSGWMTGTKDWKEIRLYVVAPAGTSTIKIGGILYGQGKAWFDDFVVAIDFIKNRKASNLALEYISSAMDTIAKHSLRKDSVDLGAIKKNALQIAGNANEYSDCHLAVEYMLNAMEDYHSFFMNANAVRAWEGSDEDYSIDIEMPSSKHIAEYGYVLIPPFHGGDSLLINKYATQLQSDLNILDNENVKGWVIDLRENTGGNMEPMIAGLGPIFDSNVLGYLVDVYGDKEAWIYDDGKYMWDDEVVLRLINPTKLHNHLPIAVLMSHQTGSSGEIVLISFIGNKDTRTFGQPSWGLTTGNGDFDLIDGSRMFLASTRMSDRNGNIFYGPVQPEVFIPVSTDEDQDEVLDRAIEWLDNVTAEKKD